MSGLPGLLTTKTKFSFIPESTREEQDAFLSQSDYFICEIQQCKIREKSCIKNQKISREKTKAGEKEIYRVFCIGCKQGEQIARKHKVKLKDKEPNKCPRCGKIVAGKTHNTLTCSDCHVKYNRERLELAEAGLTHDQIIDNL